MQFELLRFSDTVSRSMKTVSALTPFRDNSINITKIIIIHASYYWMLGSCGIKIQAGYSREVVVQMWPPEVPLVLILTDMGAPRICSATVYTPSLPSWENEFVNRLLLSVTLTLPEVHISSLPYVNLSIISGDGFQRLLQHIINNTNKQGNYFTIIGRG